MFSDYLDRYRSYVRKSDSTSDWLVDLAACLAGAVVGAGLMYIFDPVSGRRRRALIRDKVARFSFEAKAMAGDMKDYAVDKGRGLAAEAKAWATEGEVPDEALLERVRSQLGRGTSNSRNIDVSCNSGCVTLRGIILSGEMGHLLRTVRGVPGVRQVINELDGRASVENTPEHQGDALRMGNA